MDRAGYDIPAIELKPENAYLYNAKELHNDAGLDWYQYVSECVRVIGMARVLAKRNTQPGSTRGLDME